MHLLSKHNFFDFSQSCDSKLIIALHYSLLHQSYEHLMFKGSRLAILKNLKMFIILEVIVGWCPKFNCLSRFSGCILDLKLPRLWDALWTHFLLFSSIMVVVGELKLWMDYIWAQFLLFRSIIVAVGVFRFWRHNGHINHGCTRSTQNFECIIMDIVIFSRLLVTNYNVEYA